MYVYFFSDASANQKGFGAYVPGGVTQVWESASVGTEDLTSISGSYGMRIGTRSNGNEPLSLLRKMVIYTGQAYSKHSSPSLVDLLLSNRM